MGRFWYDEGMKRAKTLSELTSEVRASFAQKWLIAGLSVIALVLAATSLLVWRHYHHHPTAPVTKSTVAPAVSTPAAPPVAPTPPPDPLTIAAIKARSYPGSAITTVQYLGDQTGYRNSIVSYQSDGLKIYALMSVPNVAKPAAGWPVIILDHGYINPATYTTNGPQYRQFEAPLARAGYVVIKPDYRGNGSSQGVPEGGHFSPVYAYDNLNLVASIKQDPQMDPKRIGILAHSMGGHEALRTIVVSKDVKATAFMAGVVGSFNDIFYNWPNSPALTDQPAIVQTIRLNLIKKYGTPKDNPDFWNSASAINYVASITGTIQVNQDVGDSVVPKLFADHLVAALQAAGKPVQYNLYPGDDHNFSQNQTALINNLLKFYQSNL